MLQLGNGGNLVETRQNPLLYTIIFIILGILLFLFLVGLVLRKLRELHSTPEWIESHKNLSTTKKNIMNVAQMANLRRDERKLLEQICRKFKPQNIEYLLRNKEGIRDLFHQEYDDLKKHSASAEKIDQFFTLLYKLEKVHDSLMFITTTRALPPGQVFIYTDSDRTQWTLTLDRNDPQGLVLSIPQSFAKSEKKPAQLSKFILTFTSEAGTTYTLLTRVIRYEEEKQGKFVLIASSNNTLTAVQRREARRGLLETNCKFAAVKFSPDKKNKYDIQPTKYDGKMQDISSNGCRLCCGMPIKQGQYLSINFSLADGQEDQVIGYIVMTKKANDDSKQYILHVRFVDISIEVKNKVSAFIYGYNQA